MPVPTSDLRAEARRLQPAAAIRSSGAGSNKIADLPVHAHALPARRACSDRAATHWQNGQRPRGEPAATVPQTHSDCKANAQQSRCNRACIYMQIYSVCIQYSPCICDMDCLRLYREHPNLVNPLTDLEIKLNNVIHIIINPLTGIIGM